MKIISRVRRVLMLHGVELPVKPDDSFCTPDFFELADFYPTYVRLAGDKAVSFREYLRGICEEHENQRVRGRTAEDWMIRIVQHFGTHRVETWCSMEWPKDPEP